MKCNPDPIKQAQEITISKKKNVSTHPVVYFDNSPVNSLDSKLSFKNHLQSVFSRLNKTIRSFEKTSTYSSKKVCCDMTIFKSFIRSHLDYDHDYVYDRTSNKPSHQSLKTIQHSAAIAISWQLKKYHMRSFFKN